MANKTIGGLASTGTVVSTDLVETENTGGTESRKRTLVQIVEGAFTIGISAVLTVGTQVGLNIKAFTSHSGNLLTFRDVSNSLLAYFSRQGWLNLGPSAGLANLYTLVVKKTGSSSGPLVVVNSSDGYMFSVDEDFATDPVAGTTRAFDFRTKRLASPPTTATQLTANTNDWAPTGGHVIRFSTDASRNITGMVAGFDGEVRWLINVGSFDAVMKHQDSGSSAANRWLCTGGADVTIPANGMNIAVYDGTTTRWRLKA